MTTKHTPDGLQRIQLSPQGGLVNEMGYPLTLPALVAQCDALRAERDELRAALEIAQEHLAQYRRYSDEMRKIGRGLSISSAYHEDYADSIIRAALAKVRQP